MYQIKFRGEIHTVQTEAEYNDLKLRAQQSVEGQSIANPDDPWEFEDIGEVKTGPDA
jgi:hypothetical protein